MNYQFEDFEANAAAAANAAPETFSVSTIAAMSIAISLKRIADTMQGDDKNTGLIQALIYGMGDIAQGSNRNG